MLLRQSQVKSLNRGLTIAFCLFLISVATCSEAADADSIKNVDGDFYSRVLPLIKNAELLIEKAAGEFSARANAAKEDLLNDLNEEINKHAAEDKLEAVVEVDNARKYYESFDLTPSSGTPRPKQFYRGCLIPFERSVKTAKLAYESEIARIEKFFRKHFTNEKEQAKEELSKERQNALNQSPPDIPKAKQVQSRIDAIMRIEPPVLSQEDRRGLMQNKKQPAFANVPFNAQQANALQIAWAQHLGTEVEITNSIGMKLRVIPPGTYTDDSLSMKLQKSSAKPEAKIVRLDSPFLISTCEISQKQFEKVMNLNRGVKEDAECPITNVSWDDANEFCRRLSDVAQEKKESRVYSLPSKEQWVFAALAGDMQYKPGINPVNLLDKVAWHRGNSNVRRHATGQLLPNNFGIYDCLGNANEWILMRPGLPTSYMGFAFCDSPSTYTFNVIHKPAVTANRGYPTVGFRVICVFSEDQIKPTANVQSP